MSENLHCPKCGHEIDRANPMCPGCGAMLKVRPLKLPEKRVVKVSKTGTNDDDARADTSGGSGEHTAGGEQRGGTAKFCMGCGGKLAAGQKFCTKCGTASGARSAGRTMAGGQNTNGNAMASGMLFAINAKSLMTLAAVVVACVCAVLWIGGCVDAATSVEEGMNYFTYRSKVNNMNVISRSGFNFYMDNFTDAPEKKKEVDDAMQSLRGLFGL